MVLVFHCIRVCYVLSSQSRERHAQRTLFFFQTYLLVSAHLMSTYIEGEHLTFNSPLHVGLAVKLEHYDDDICLSCCLFSCLGQSRTVAIVLHVRRVYAWLTVLYWRTYINSRLSQLGYIIWVQHVPLLNDVIKFGRANPPGALRRVSALNINGVLWYGGSAVCARGMRHNIKFVCLWFVLAWGTTFTPGRQQKADGQCQ